MSPTQRQRSSTSSEENPGPIATISPGLPPGEVGDQYLDSTKLRELTGWAPAVDLRTGLGRTVDWYREHEEVRP